MQNIGAARRIAKAWAIAFTFNLHTVLIRENTLFSEKQDFPVRTALLFCAIFF